MWYITPPLPHPHTLTANLLYKAALREVVAIQDTDGSPPEGEEQSAAVPFNPNTPHPYQLALGVLCIQKVLFPEPPYQFLSCKISRRKTMNPISFSLPVLGWLLAYSEAYAHIHMFNCCSTCQRSVVHAVCLSSRPSWRTEAGSGLSSSRTSGRNVCYITCTTFILGKEGRHICCVQCMKSAIIS